MPGEYQSEDCYVVSKINIGQASYVIPIWHFAFARHLDIYNKYLFQVILYYAIFFQELENTKLV